MLCTVFYFIYTQKFSIRRLMSESMYNNDRTRCHRDMRYITHGESVYIPVYVN